MRSVSREGLDGGRDAAPNYIRLPALTKKKNWPELVALTSTFLVELPGIEPVVLAR